MRATFFAVAASFLTAQAGAQQPVERRISCTVSEVWTSPVTGEIKRTKSTSIVVPHTRAGHARAEAQFERERASAAAAFLEADSDWRKCPAGSPCQAEAFTRSLEYFVA